MPWLFWLFGQYVQLGTCLKHLLVVSAKGLGAVGDSISCLGIVSNEISDSSLHQDKCFFRTKKKEEGPNKDSCFSKVVCSQQPCFSSSASRCLWSLWAGIAPSCCGKEIWGKTLSGHQGGRPPRSCVQFPSFCLFIQLTFVESPVPSSP